jgi:hypothetical protein
MLPCDRALPTDVGTVIELNTSASDEESDVLSYAYFVSAGKIVGSGSQVKWDLTGVPPGRYTVSVGVDDGFGMFGTTRTQTVSVMKCVSSN